MFFSNELPIWYSSNHSLEHRIKPKLNHQENGFYISYIYLELNYELADL
jgi:hypothetical protein